MLHSFFSKTNSKGHYLFIVIVACVVFWPLAGGAYSLKNDAYIYFLPWRYHISETIQYGEFPFWNPYLYTGLPLYSDMQSGTWNPVVLLISLFTRYNMQVLEWELLFYIIFAGIGMYKLVKENGHLPLTAITCCIAYMSCGFITDSGSFIPWITSAAWLPFAFLYFMRLLKNPGMEHAAKFGLALFLLLTAGYPGYFIYAGYIFLAASISHIIVYRRNREQWLPQAKYLVISALLLLVLALPAVLSFYDFTSYYQRGSGATPGQALTNPFPPFATISYLLPSAGVKEHAWLATDLSMRDASIGLFMFIFFLLSLTTRLTVIQKFILGVTLFSFVFSLGNFTPLRKWCYDLLPFMNSFRHPAIIRLFTSIGLILLAAKAIDLFLTDRQRIEKKLKLVLLIIAGILTALVAYYAATGFRGMQIYQSGQSMKQMIDRMNFPDIAVIQGLIQLLFLFIFLLFMKRKRLPVALIGLNCITLAWMALPFTLVSQVKTKTIDHFIHSFPKGFPLPVISEPVDPLQRPVHDANTFTSFYFFYDKKIQVQPTVITPTLPVAYFTYLSNRSLQKNAPLTFVSTVDSLRDSTASVIMEKMFPSVFQIRLTTARPGYLHLVQQYHHRWEAIVNGKTVPIERSHAAFMKVPVPAGDSTVVFRFNPGIMIRTTMITSAIGFLLLLLFTLFQFIKKIRR